MTTASKVCITALLCVVFICLGAETEHGQLQRYALVIGSNLGTKTQGPLRYAVSDANAFTNVLTTMGGVSRDHLILITDPSIKDFKNGIEQLQSLAVQAAPGPGRKEIIIYYSGHADEQGIILKKENLSYQEFKKMVDAIPVDVRIAILDACASGSITREKGGAMRPAFLFDASAAMEGHAYLTSSSFDESAQESDRIKGSFFTHYLISAMRGGADANTDGKVTLNEAYEFAFDETLRRTEKTLSGPQHAAYDIRLKGSGDLVMTDLRASSAGLRIDPSLSGRVFIRDVHGTLLAELNKIPGKPMEVGLEPGTYDITLEKPPELLSTQVTLAHGGYTDLLMASLLPASMEQTVSRGDGGMVLPEQSQEKYRVIGFNVGILPAVSIGGTDDKLLTHCAINLAVGSTSRLEGITISSGINTVSEKAQGAMIAAGGNFCEQDIDGIQIAGGINTAGGSGHCAQIAGGYNQTNNLYGIQITGGANFVTSAAPGGAQISGGFNSTAGSIRGIQITGGMNIASDTSYCAQIAGGINKAGVIQGIQIAGGANIASQQMPNGAQISGGYNLAPGDFNGIQITGGMNQTTGLSWGMHIAGGMNMVSDGLYGGQIAGGMNYAGLSLKGIQLAGGVNGLRGDCQGAQIAGGVNFCRSIDGAQIGVVNIGKTVRGVQIGVINISDSCEGLPIGLFSLIGNNPPHARIWTDESGHIQTGFRTGSDYLYTIWAIGARPERDPVQWNIGYGFGGRIPIKRAYIGLEKMFIHSNLGRTWDTKQIVHTKDMLTVGFKMANRFSIWLGPSVNMYWSSVDKTDKKLAFGEVTLHEYRKSWYAVWPGFVAGLEF